MVNIKRIIGLTGNEEDFKTELKHINYSVSSNNEIEVIHQGQKRKFSPVQIAAMLLEKVKEIADRAPQVQGRPTKDVVVSVPGYWTEFQRRAMLDATRIAGLNCLRLINDHTATALSYGIYKTNLSETEPTKVMFTDMGYANTTVFIVDFVKGKLTVTSCRYDRNLGGRDFDELLVQHFAKEFKTKYKIDILSNARAKLRLSVACEKLKKVLTINSEGTINVDSIMNDVDVRSSLTRKQFEEISQPLLDRLEPLINAALQDANTTVDKLFAIEMTGSGTRATIVQTKLQEILKRELSKTLNFEESVSKGCALNCAQLSPIFKVREFAIVDIQPYPIKFSWRDRNGDPMETDEK